MHPDPSSSSATRIIYNYSTSPKGLLHHEKRVTNNSCG